MRKWFFDGRLVFLIFVVMLTACSGQSLPEEPVVASPSAVSTISPNAIVSDSTAQSSEVIEIVPTVPVAETNRRVEVEDGIQFPQLLPLDGIRPVYAPEFETAENVSLQENELIIGISLGGESKAYPITVLRFREMVDDQLAGIPILVTW